MPNNLTPILSFLVLRQTCQEECATPTSLSSTHSLTTVLKLLAHHSLITAPVMITVTLMLLSLRLISELTLFDFQAVFHTLDLSLMCVCDSTLCQFSNYNSHHYLGSIAYSYSLYPHLSLFQLSLPEQSQLLAEARHLHAILD